MRYSYAPGSAAAHERSIAERTGDTPAPSPAYVVIKPAQPYDLATPGTPLGLRQLSAAAAEGGIFTQAATFALAVSADGLDVVATLALRLRGDSPGRVRRAYACYARRLGEDGSVSWLGDGSAILDSADEARPIRHVGILELRAIVAGRVYTPPPPRPGPPRLRCYTCDKVTSFSTTTWRPYARHRCELTKQTEGRS